MSNSSGSVGAVRGSDTDVLIVGYGPVGQVLSNLLAKRGWSVAVVERWPQPYTMPRAVAFDGEAARVLAAAGVGDFIQEFGECSRDYTWRTAAGETLLHSEVSERGWCGWADSTSMYQPGLEAELTAQGTTLACLQVFRGHQAVDLVERDDQVEVITEGPGQQRWSFSARWVVGCDGANSFVRERMGVSMRDLGFSHDWLICDVVMREPRDFMPNNLQICDPARPRTAVSAGPGHRRWEFMRLPAETVAELNTEEAAWRLLTLFDINQKNASLDRHAVYTFEASYAERWRSGRMLLVGDAAHLMPPFAGQGMSSGFRDAINLTWKLDLVLRGVADESTLDTYAVERREHVQHAIGISVNLGKVICHVDPEAAADHHAVLLAAREYGTHASAPRSTFQPLSDGLVSRGESNVSGGPLPQPVGALMPQGRVARNQTGLFDEVVGRGFMVIVSEDPNQLLDAESSAFLHRIGAQTVRVLPPDAPPGRVDEHTVIDIDDVYLPYLADSGATAMIVRPDFYCFGSAGGANELARLVTELRSQLCSSVLAS